MRFQKRDIFESKVLLAEEQDVVLIRRATVNMDEHGWLVFNPDHVAKEKKLHDIIVMLQYVQNVNIYAYVLVLFLSTRTQLCRFLRPDDLWFVSDYLKALLRSYMSPRKSNK